MAVLVTMKISPPDTAKFEAALRQFQPPGPGDGCRQHAVARAQADAASYLFTEVWESHDHMHRFQDRVGADFNRDAGTEGANWETQVWDLIA